MAVNSIYVVILQPHDQIWSLIFSWISPVATQEKTLFWGRG
jgi:hypothetical protein